MVVEGTCKDEIKTREVSQLHHGNREDKASTLFKPIMHQEETARWNSLSYFEMTQPEGLEATGLCSPMAPPLHLLC